MRAIVAAVITASDTGAAGQRRDESGPLAQELLKSRLKATCDTVAIVPDERDVIASRLRDLVDNDKVDLIVTTGGTGFAPRDVIDRGAPGLAEAMRAAGMQHTPLAMLSRGVCGLRGTTLIVNCSGSPKAVREQLEAVLRVLPHAIEAARGDAVDCASLRTGGQTE